ncbi:MAG: ankyrin repeat domain-containing protein, partial [Campylobacterota bacterium]|nr:ankyrin repeat domain-containing protein [Campylobacterota bacterium]
MKKSKFKSVIWLIHNNINLKLKNKNGKNIFDISIEIHNHKIVEELLKTDQFDINKKDKCNRTLLQDMVVLGDNDMAQLLIKYGALLNSKDNHNRNVLFDAVSYGDIKFIEFLLTFQDLELNNIDDNGDTIMHHPFIKQNDEVAQMLISNGADTTIKDKDGKTYLCAAALRGMESYHLVDEALKSGANINSRVVN